MQLYEGTTKTGLIQEIDRLCDSDDTSYPRIAKTSRINNALEEIVGDILGWDGTWDFDDTNYTDLPIATTDLVANQKDYSFDVSHLEIQRVEVKDANGDWRLLEPIDKSKVPVALNEFYSTASIPLYYDKQGASLFLYPSPDNGVSVTLTAGLKVYFKRTGYLFTVATGSSDDTTKAGFASPFHKILAYMASIPYCMTYKKDRVVFYQREVGSADTTSPLYGGIKKAMKDFYTKRERDVRKQITTKCRKFR